MNIRVENNSIVISNYFRDKKHIEDPYTDGLYGIFPQGGCVNIYNPEPKKYSSNLMEWAYNNPYQPFAETDQLTGKRLPLLDGSHANSFSNLGCLKDIWKEFEKEGKLFETPLEDIDINEIEERFWNFYISQYSSNFNAATAVLQNYVRERRRNLTEEQREIEKREYPEFRNEETWISGCKDFLRHLIYTSPRGYIYELILLAALKQITGRKITESSAAGERKGIDGYVGSMPVSLKPSSYKSEYISPLDQTCFVTYEKKNQTYPDLVFRFLSGEKILKNHQNLSEPCTVAC